MPTFVSAWASSFILQLVESLLPAVELAKILSRDHDWLNTNRFWCLKMRDRIAVDPKIHFGKPCITGTRIPVQNVLELVRDGVTFDTIIGDYYPDLTLDDIRACEQYAMDGVSQSPRR